MYSQIVKAARIQSVERVGKSMAIRCAFVVCINYNRRARDRERERNETDHQHFGIRWQYEIVSRADKKATAAITTRSAQPLPLQALVFV